VVALFTQSLGEVANSEIFELLMTACPTKIFLPNYAAGDELVRPLYKKFGLNDRQIDIIKDAIPKREYYIAQPEGNRLFNLNLGELALAFVAKSSKLDVQAVRDHVSQYGDEWYAHWLVTCKVIDEQTRRSSLAG
ncbi:conjugal transfer protein TrbE, partial [Shewanella sairae]|nr:conjugal transfer protein TrbE [Shewanella sairae]